MKIQRANPSPHLFWGARTVVGLWRIERFSNDWNELIIHCSLLRMNWGCICPHSIFRPTNHKRWHQLTTGLVLYPTDNPAAGRLGLCITLSTWWRDNVLCLLMGRLLNYQWFHSRNSGRLYSDFHCFHGGHVCYQNLWRLNTMTVNPSDAKSQRFGEKYGSWCPGPCFNIP